MPTIALTDRFCSTAKALGVQTDYFDEQVAGLAFRVTNRGNRSWCFHYRSPRDGKRARATIGTYPATSLAMARERRWRPEVTSMPETTPGSSWLDRRPPE